MRFSQIFLGAIITALFIFFTLFSQRLVAGSDFVNLYTGTLILKNGQGERLYDLDQQQVYYQQLINTAEIKFLPFRQPPLIALLFYFLSFLTLGKAYLVFAYLNLILLSLFYLLAKKIFTNISHNLLFVILIFLSFPALHTIFTGQTTILLSIILLIFYLCLKRQNWLSAGMIGGLIFFLKIQLITLLPLIFLIAKNKKKFTSGFILSSIVLSIISILPVGLSGLLNYPGFIMQTENSSYGSNLWDSFSLTSWLSQLGFDGARLLIANAFLYFCALVFFSLNLKKRNLEQNFVIASVLAAFFAVHFLAHDLTILNVAILVLSIRCYVLGKNDGKDLFSDAALIYSLIFFLAIPVVFGAKLNLSPFALILTVLLLIRQKKWI